MYNIIQETKEGAGGGWQLVMSLAVHDEGSRGRLSQLNRMTFQQALLDSSVPHQVQMLFRLKEEGGVIVMHYTFICLTHNPHGSAGGFPGLLHG